MAASQKIRGRYLGLSAHATRKVKAAAKAIYKSKGIRSAIAYLKKHR